MVNSEIEQTRKEMTKIIRNFKQERLMMDDPIIYLEEIQSKLNISDEKFINALSLWDEINFVPIMARKNNKYKNYVFLTRNKLHAEKYYALYWV